MKGKRKLKLNALYGQMVQASTEDAFKICARRVRCVSSCNQCLHYAECRAFNRPASRLGRFIAKLELETIPLLYDSMAYVCGKPISIKSRRPLPSEIAADEDIIWCVSLHMNMRRIRIPLHDGPNDDLLTKLYAAYIELLEGGGRPESETENEENDDEEEL